MNVDNAIYFINARRRFTNLAIPLGTLDFAVASQQLALWLNTVAIISKGLPNDSHLLPCLAALKESHLRYHEIIFQSLKVINILSDRPVVWKHGRCHWALENQPLMGALSRPG
jgi:hypothetical protein